MFRRAVLLLLLWPPLGWAGDIEAPAEVKVKPGRLKKIEVKTTLERLQWLNLSDELDVIPSETGQWVIVSAPSAGSYKIAAYGARLDNGKAVPTAPAYVVVTVEGPTPIPLPTPGDPLGPALQAALQAEVDPAKALWSVGLALVYRAGQSAASDNGVSTWDDLFARVADKAQTLGVAQKLVGVQKAVQSEALRVLPQSANLAAPLSAADRTAAAQLFNRAAAILEGTK